MDYMIFQKNIQNLPIELQNIIISYTYSPQPMPLLRDIRDFYDSISLVYTYIEETDALQAYYLNSAIDDFHNELHTYIHYYLYDGTMENISEYFWKRYFMYRTMDITHISRLIMERMNEYPINSQLRIIWGLFTPEERCEFIDFYEEEYFEEEEDYDF